MNIKILQKCVEALNSEKPDISYIKGMLETLIELGNQPQQTNGNITRPKINDQPVSELTDQERAEAIAALRYAGGSVGNLT